MSPSEIFQCVVIFFISYHSFNQWFEIKRLRKRLEPLDKMTVLVVELANDKKKEGEK